MALRIQKFKKKITQKIKQGENPSAFFEALAAIKKDQLKWDYHVSELAKWDTKAAKAYGVTGIPKTFLIDREGNIAAINPRYNLEEALLKVL